jgi:hypothetical protein
VNKSYLRDYAQNLTFVRRHLRLFLRGLLVLNILGIALALLAVYLYLFQPETKYFATTSDGGIIRLQQPVHIKKS